MARRGSNSGHLLGAFILLAQLFFSPLVGAQNSFVEIEKDYKHFKNDLEARKYRHHYENLIERFKNFERKFSKSAKAKQALFSIAELNEDIANITRSHDDFKLAERAYLVVTSRFKNEKIADEALFRAAKIRMEILHDKDGTVKLMSQFLPAKMKSSSTFERSRAYLSNLKNDVLPKQKKNDVIRQISFQEINDGLRVIVNDFSDSKINQGEVGKTKDLPRRIFFDLALAELDEKIPFEFNVNQKDVYKIRVGQHSKDTVRIVIEVNEDVKATVSLQKETLILDFFKKSSALALNAPVPVAKQAPEFLRREDVYRPKVIVIDPGHGGEDPGAIGPRGLKEKTVTLEIARRVKDYLEKELTHVKVHLTRAQDQTVSLAKRTELANQLEADLFISIHANAAPNVHAQGIETYYLNISHDRYAIRLAARENAMSETEISNLEFILADLAMKSNVSDSIRLGQVVQSAMYTKVKEKWRDAKDLGLKHALFYVLMGTRMPSILIETSFISNKVEEKRLKSDSYQQALAQGVVKGIKRYIEDQQAMYMP